MTLDNAVKTYATTWTTEDPDYCGSTELEVNYGVTGYDREMGDIRYDEIPESGTGNVWMTHIWWSDAPEHPCSNGDYIYQTGWNAQVQVAPTTAPDGHVIDYPTRVHNPEPDDSDWESNDIDITAAATLGPFSASTGLYTIDADGTSETVKTYDGHVKYEKITWDVFHGSLRTAWSDSQNEANGAQFQVSSEGLDASKDYDPRDLEGEYDIVEDVEQNLSYTYDYNGTRIYESLGGWVYPDAHLISL